VVPAALGKPFTGRLAPLRLVHPAGVSEQLATALRPESPPHRRTISSANIAKYFSSRADRPRKRTRAAGMLPAAHALRSSYVVRRAASRGGTLRCAEAPALPTVMSISPTLLTD
jgi:hypothetical protein